MTLILYTFKYVLMSIEQDFLDYYYFTIQYKYDTSQDLLDYWIEFKEKFPNKAKSYIENYINQTKKYKNLFRTFGQLRFSLYQPDITTNAGKRYIFYRLLRKFEMCRIPSTLTVGLTKKCQCNCLHCSANYHMNQKEKELTTKQFISAIEESIELGVTTVVLVGGEPLLNKDLDKIISSVDKNKANVVLFTNGEFLTKEKCKKLKASGLDGIFVSLDSYKKEEHNQLRKRNIFDKAIEGIQNALQVKIPVAISSYFTKDRVEAYFIENMMAFAKELNVQEVTFFDAIPTGRMYSSVSSFLDLEARKKILYLTHYYRSKKDYPIITPQSVFTSQKECSRGYCFAATTQFYLSSQGYVCPCDFTPLTVGKYPEFSIKTLWEKLITIEPYKKRSKECRMQDPHFRNQYIYRIPKDASLPYPIDLLQ